MRPPQQVTPARGFVDRVARAADERTRIPRSRAAEAIFLGKPGRPSDQALASAYFSLFSWVWASLASDTQHLEPFVEAIAAVRLDPSPRLVVDVGTGAGRTAVLLSDRYPDARVEGLDTSRRMLRQARRHSRSNLTFRRGDVRRLPYPPGAVDLMACVNAIISPGETRRVLRAGGILVTASTWFPPRDESSLWMRTFRASGFDLVQSAACGQGSWEVWRAARD